MPPVVLGKRFGPPVPQGMRPVFVPNKRSRAAATVQAAVRRRTARYGRTPATRALTLAQRRAVKQLISSAAEVKIRTFTMANKAAILGGGLASTGFIANGYGFLLDNFYGPTAAGVAKFELHQGTTQQQRIGNEVSVKKYEARINVSSMPQSASNPSPACLQAYKIVVVGFRQKIGPVLSTASGPKLKIGISNADEAVDGTIANHLLPFNRDQFDIWYYKELDMRPPFYVAEDAPGAGNQTFLQNPQASNSPAMRQFSLNLPHPKHLEFKDGSNVPSNAWGSLGFYIINTDGAATLASTTKAQVSINTTLYFTDQ